MSLYLHVRVEGMSTHDRKQQQLSVRVNLLDLEPADARWPPLTGEGVARWGVQPVANTRRRTKKRSRPEHTPPDTRHINIYRYVPNSGTTNCCIHRQLQPRMHHVPLQHLNARSTAWQFAF